MRNCSAGFVKRTSLTTVKESTTSASPRLVHGRTSCEESFRSVLLLIVNWVTPSVNSRRYIDQVRSLFNPLIMIAAPIFCEKFPLLYAVIQGLPATYSDQPTLQVLFAMLDSEGNYSLYRRMWEKTRGLPILFPHIEKFAIDGEDSLTEVFPSRQMREERPIKVACSRLGISCALPGTLHRLYRVGASR